MIAYRATVYKPRSQNDARESEVLVPAAGAPHADEFRVSTLPEFQSAGEGLLTDPFPRADNVASMGAAPDGHVWSTHGGVAGISGNRAYFSTATTDDAA